MNLNDAAVSILKERDALAAENARLREALKKLVNAAAIFRDDDSGTVATAMVLGEALTDAMIALNPELANEVFE